MKQKSYNQSRVSEENPTISTVMADSSYVIMNSSMIM